MSGTSGYTFSPLSVSDIPRADLVLPGAARLVDAALAEELSANPDTTEETPCLFCLSDSGGRVVSWIRVWADRVWINGREAPWLWTGDLTTVPDLRGRGLATELQRAGSEWTRQRGIGRGSVFSTEETLHIYRKLGYLTPGFATRRVQLKTLRPVIAAHVAPAAVAITSAAAQPIAALARSFLAARCRQWRGASDARVLPDARADGVAQVLDRAARLLPVHFNMSPAKLQWTLDFSARKPGTRDLLLVADRAGQPIAIAVTRTRMETEPLAGRYRDFRCMTLMDFALADRGEPAVRALLGHVGRHFLESDAEVLQLIAYDRTMARLAARAGFLRAGRGMSFACHLPSSLPVPDAAGEISTWPVTHFSGDGPFL